MAVEEKKVKISYFSKNPLECPLCGTSFRKEEMLTGGGRLIARDISDELRRRYEPGKKVGEVYPLVYPVTVCPQCLYAAYGEDFMHISCGHKEAALSQMSKRRHDIKLIFPIIDFSKPRNLFTGTASYMLATGCYSFHGGERAPTFKKGLSCLRAAWLFDDLNGKYPAQGYDRISSMCYSKALVYYEKTIDLAQTGKERLDVVKNVGPDLDKNYGFQGILYITTLLIYKYGPKDTEKLQSAKRIISKVFGSGKSSRSKPGFILDKSKELYERIDEKIAEIEGV